MSALRNLTAILVLLAPALPVSAGGVEIDPAVLSVSSGPWVWASGGYHFRAVTVATRGFVALHVQKIELDPETETLELVKNLSIDLAPVGSAVFEIEGIAWSGPSAFRFRANSKLYAIQDLDGTPEISLAGPIH